MSACAFCSRPAAHSLVGHDFCPACWATFWRISERWCEGGSPPACEGCGAGASHVVDHRWFCASCHLVVAEHVGRAGRALALAGTLAEITELPEAEGGARG